MNAQKPICRLVGTHGNVFAIINTVQKTLDREEMPERADEWVTKAMECKSYDEVLRLLFDYVEPT